MTSTLDLARCDGSVTAGVAVVLEYREENRLFHPCGLYAADARPVPCWAGLLALSEQQGVWAVL